MLILLSLNLFLKFKFKFSNILVIIIRFNLFIWSFADLKSFNHGILRQGVPKNSNS